MNSMKKIGAGMRGALCLLCLAAGLVFAGCEQVAGVVPDDGAGFVAVSGISGIPTGGYRGAELDLSRAAVTPPGATNRTIEWTVLEGGGTGISSGALAGGKVTPGAPGVLRLLASVPDGKAPGVDYTLESRLVIGAVFVPVNGISGVPLSGTVQAVLDLSGAVVSPDNAVNKTILWSVIDGGGTGVGTADLAGGKAAPTATGFLQVRATIAGGAAGGDYTEDFTIGIGEGEGSGPAAIAGITVSSLPATTYYAKNQSFNPAGLEVRYVNENGGYGAALAAGDYTLDPVDTSTPGLKPVRITSAGYQPVYFSIFVDPSDVILRSLALTSAPSKMEYDLGESFDPAGMVITGTYSDGSTKTVDNSIVAVSGYDKFTRGSQTLTLRINTSSLTLPGVKVVIPSGAAITLNPYRAGSANHAVQFYRTVYVKGRPFDFEKSNLQATVKFGSVTAKLTPGRGLYPADLTGFNPNLGGAQQLTLTLDNASVTFDVYVANVEPAVWFDYGYMRHEADPTGRGPGAGVYYARPDETLVLAPVRYLIGYDAENRNLGAAYAWTVSGGDYDTAAARNRETFAFTPAAAGTYTVQVSVTGRDYATGATITKTASTDVVCYTEPLSAGTFGVLRNFAPGQFTQSGNGYGWSLGGAGGYEVWHVTSRDSYIIQGNPMATWMEAGVVWVMEDRNGNGIPDEMWYELRGSDETHSSYKNLITRRYAITWIKSGEKDVENEYGQTIAGTYWVDSKGRAGLMYGGWPSNWGVTGGRVTYTGTLLRDDGNIDTGTYGGLINMAGYVDTGNYGKWTGDNWDRYYVSDAMRADGEAVSLSAVRFIKVQTAIHRYGGIFGEVSTEIKSATDLGSQSDFPDPVY
ncbi:MAG: bacterial Ig-like domain-containing protein [Spirochaetaceae bacterium]|jgi:hypothetical protein|nr:bacterial Ig-like domain-containing protein [Spirochaetaceae bacterium]